MRGSSISFCLLSHSARASAFWVEVGAQPAVGVVHHRAQLPHLVDPPVPADPFLRIERAAAVAGDKQGQKGDQGQHEGRAQNDQHHVEHPFQARR